MPRTTQVVSISADPDVLRLIDKARGKVSRSEFLIDGATRLAQLQSIADQGLAQFNADASRARSRNPTEIIAEASTAGRALLRALEEIAREARK
jgi:hypothetical protein